MFTGTPVAATEPPAPNAPLHSRVLLVGDSTLAAVEHCCIPSRRRVRSASRASSTPSRAGGCSAPSCLSAVTHVVPNTAVEAILEHAGHDRRARRQDRIQRLEQQLPGRVRRRRQRRTRQGRTHDPVAELHRERQVARSRRQAYQENNVDLFHLVTLPQYSDVVLADWRAYTAGIDGLDVGRQPPDRDRLVVADRLRRRAGWPRSSIARARARGVRAARTSTRARPRTRSVRCPTCAPSTDVRPRARRRSTADVAAQTGRPSRRPVATARRRGRGRRAPGDRHAARSRRTSPTPCLACRARIASATRSSATWPSAKMMKQ